jgi:predicted MFS family arabinose efflux permease
MNQYLTLVLKDAGYGTFTTNLLTIPAYCIFILNLLFWCFLSEKINERLLLATVSQFWVMPLLIALETLPTTRSPWATWILSVLIYAMPYFHPVIVAITSRNAGTVRTRTVASALYNMMVQTSNIYGANVSNFHKRGASVDFVLTSCARSIVLRIVLTTSQEIKCCWE